MGKLYDDKSIESLSPLEFTRLRPGVYAGDTTYATQLLVEIFSNAVDEFNAGNASTINVFIDKDVVEVEDNGQGFLVNSKREDGKTVLEAAFSVLNTSGKYREDGAYEGTSLGSFGIGSKITTFLSHWLEVVTFRDGNFEKLTFKEGVFDKREVGKTKSPSGTQVRWQASEEFFNNPEVEIKKIKDLFETISCLCPGLIINLDDNGTKTVYKSKNGLNDLVDRAVKNSELLDKRLVVNFAEGKYKLDLVMTYTSNYSSTIVSYVNAGLVESSPVQTQIKTAITREMNKFMREKKWLKEKDENLTGDDIQEGMYIVFNATAPSVSYDSQVKTRIVSMDCKAEVAAFTEALCNWMERNEKEVKLIADKAIAAKKARDAAKKARDAARDNDKKTKEKKVIIEDKLADCEYHNEKSECYITEGDSATGGLKEGRDSDYQAVLPIRGKVLNCEKAAFEKIIANAEIVNMMNAWFGKDGWSVDYEKKTINYNMKKLRFGKIIFESDADIDGAHIKNLLYTMVWNICPDLIIGGYIYAGVPPLYKITEKNGKSYEYLNNDAELNAYREAHKGEKYDVGRMKGLGEMDSDEVAATLMNPEKRIIKKVVVGDMTTARKVFNDIMGEDPTPRKKLLKEHAHEARYNAE